MSPIGTRADRFNSEIKQTARPLPEAIRPALETPDPGRIVAGSYGPQAMRWARRQLGLVLMRWQRYVVSQILRHDARGDLIARVALLSTARQNGKTAIVRTVFGWMLDEGQFLPPFAEWRDLLSAAHDAKQARIPYRFVHDDLANRIEPITPARLTMFQGISAGHVDYDIATGQPGSVRGMSPGLIGWDEMLTQTDWSMWEALYPTQSAQRSPLMLLTSTAGFADSVVLRSLYERLQRQATGAEEADPTFYGAWWQSHDPDAALDWAELARANPGMLDGRPDKQAIRSEYAILPPDSWRRERMNHWIDARADRAVQPAAWAACRMRDPLAGVSGPFALGVDVHPTRATIAVAALRDDGRIGAEIFRDFRSRPPASQIVTEIHRFENDERQVVKCAYDKQISGASTFERDGQEAYFPWDALSPAAMVAACMDVAEMIESGRLAVDDPLVDAQVAIVARRGVGSEGAFRYSRNLSDGPIDAFLAVVLAAHAIAYAQQVPQIF